jgi:hypothetical protein
VKPFTYHEIETVIKKGIHPKKALGFDLITGTILKEVSDKCLILVKYILTPYFELNIFPANGKWHRSL